MASARVAYTPLGPNSPKDDCSPSVLRTTSGGEALETTMYIADLGGECDESLRGQMKKSAEESGSRKTSWWRRYPWGSSPAPSAKMAHNNNKKTTSARKSLASGDDARLFGLVLSVQCLQFGLFDSWFTKCLSYWLSAKQVHASQRQALLTFATVPWGFRYPIFALLSLCPSHVSIPLSKVVGTLAVAILARFSPEEMPLEVFAACVMIVYMDGSLDSALLDGVLSKRLRTSEHEGKTLLMSATWMIKHSFNIIGLVLAGEALKHFHVQTSFFLLAVVSFIVFFILSWSLDPTSPSASAPPQPPEPLRLAPIVNHAHAAPTSQHRRIDIPKNPKNPPPSLPRSPVAEETKAQEVAAAAAAPSPMSSSSSSSSSSAARSSLGERRRRRFRPAAPLSKPLLASLYIGAATIVASALPLCGGSEVTSTLVALAATAGGVVAVWWAMGERVGMLAAFMCVRRACKLNISNATFLFYTAPPESYANGPHLDPVFYTTVMGILANACVFVSVGLYYKCLRTWSSKRVFYLTYTLHFAVQVCSLPLFLEWFRDTPGLARTFILFEETAEVVVQNLNDVPNFLLLSAAAAEGTDTSVTALCAAASHLASTVNSAGGSLVLVAFGVDPAGGSHEDAQFRNLGTIKAGIVFFQFAVSLLAVRFFLPSEGGGGGQQHPDGVDARSHPHPPSPSPQRHNHVNHASDEGAAACCSTKKMRHDYYDENNKGCGTLQGQTARNDGGDCESRGAPPDVSDASATPTRPAACSRRGSAKRLLDLESCSSD